MLKRLLLISLTIFLVTNLFAQDNSLAYSGAGETESQISVTFKPNPLSSSARVEIEGMNTERYKFLVYDITGRLVRQYSQQYQNSFVFEREDLEKGFYLYKLITPDKEVTAGRFQVID